MKKTNIIKAVIMGAITVVSIPALSHFSPKGEAMNVYKSEVNAGVETDELEVDDGKVEMLQKNADGTVSEVNLPYIYYPSNRYITLSLPDPNGNGMVDKEYRIMYYYDYDGSQVFTDGLILSPNEAEATIVVNNNFNGNGMVEGGEYRENNSKFFAHNGEAICCESGLWTLGRITLRVPEQDTIYKVKYMTYPEQKTDLSTYFDDNPEEDYDKIRAIRMSLDDISLNKIFASDKDNLYDKTEVAQNWDIIYRVYQKDSGWTEWGRNGEVVGEESDDAEIITKFQVNMVRKGSPFPQD